MSSPRGIAHGGYYRAPVARSLPAFLAQQTGLSANALLDQAGIDPARFDDPEHVFSLGHAAELLERAAGAAQNPFIGLDYATQLPWVDLGVLGYVMSKSPTLGAGFENAKRFTMKQTPGGIHLEVQGSLARLGYNLRAESVPEQAQLAELMLALLTRFAREHTARKNWAPSLVRFTRRAPKGRSRHREYFRARCAYEEPLNELCFDAAELALPLETSDPGLLPFLVRHAEDCLARMPAAGDELSHVRRAVIDSLSAGDCTIEQIADRLQTSPRSLQRRLAARAQTFKTLVEETRLALARRYLDDPSLSLTETAYLLGYSDLSAFSRAYRRWTGESAIEFRKRRR